MMTLESIDIPALFKSVASAAIAQGPGANPLDMLRSYLDVAGFDSHTAREVERRFMAHWRRVASEYPWEVLSESQMLAIELSQAVNSAPTASEFLNAWHRAIRA